jgi:hypothetical protein
MKTYTVVGVVGCDQERYAATVRAEDSHEAEEKANLKCLDENGCNLEIAAVILGKAKIVG